MAVSADDLVGYLKSEFAKASRWRLGLLAVQFMATIPAALSVIISDATLLYYLAIVGPVLLGAWWIARMFYRRTRSAAHSARRANLILGGLGENYSPEEHQRLRQLFTVEETTASSRSDPAYFATEAMPGPRRLGEMLEESAFYSREIHRVSGTIMALMFLAFLATAAIVALSSVPYAERVTAMVAIKILLAATVFLLSSDVLGAMTEHWEGARVADDVRGRMAAAHAKGFPTGDVLLAMVDYNNAMEGAPEAVPGVYKALEAKLNRRWAEYKSDRDQARANQGAHA